LKKYNITSSELSLAPGEAEGEFLVKINVGRDYDAQQLLSLIADLKILSDDAQATTTH